MASEKFRPIVRQREEEALLDPERAAEVRRIADEKMHGNFMDAIGDVDFATQRARLLHGRQEAPSAESQPAVRGNPNEKAGLLTASEYMKEQNKRIAEENARILAENMKDPKFRHEEKERLLKEQAEKDVAAFARDEEARAKRLEDKKRKLQDEPAKATAKKGKKGVKFAFEEDDGDDSEEFDA
eukprot:TRINITY_DN84275_c0_g1_i1.p1 TRINITY_DN84275_c0_g1~~TRINITY_DN84275_c0_g1_i1.p1  ORF type:complete len:184 (+),score=56.97 TRINITY_DN84275_c0_g1_i1:117-668(+)